MEIKLQRVYCKGMKKVLAVLLIVCCICLSVFAGDFKFLFKDLDQHTELLYGFLPSLIQAGASYEGLSLMPLNLTQIQLSGAAGYTQRAVFQHPDTGEPLDDLIQVYDVIQIRWDLEFLQGLGESPVEGKDLVTVYLGLQGRWEKAVDSLLIEGGGFPKPADIKRDRGTSGKIDVQTIDSWFTDMEAVSSRENSPIYPDFGVDGKVSNALYAGARLNLMDDRWTTNDGILAEARVLWSPSSFFGFWTQGVWGKTLYEAKNPKGLNLFSVVILDRVRFSFLDGPSIPVYAQSKFSLGRNVRGFNSNSYNSNFCAVNSLEVRFAGPEFLFHGIFPRLNVFFDLGYGWGNYFNTGHGDVAAVRADNYLASVGAQLEMDFFDMFDLGLQAAYLLNGTNLRKPGINIQISATFFLDF